MKKLLISAATLSLLSSGVLSSAEAGRTYVDGYTRSDGTYVRPHYRNTPGSSSPSYYSSPAYTPSIAPPPPSFNFPSCAEAANLGFRNMGIGSAGYSQALDRDGDGIACEAGGEGAGASSGTPGLIVTPVGSTTAPAAAPFNPARHSYEHFLEGGAGTFYFSEQAFINAGGHQVSTSAKSRLFLLQGDQLEVTIDSRDVSFNLKNQSLNHRAFVLDGEMFIPTEALELIGCKIQTYRPILNATCKNGVVLKTDRVLPN